MGGRAQTPANSVRSKVRLCTSTAKPTVAAAFFATRARLIKEHLRFCANVSCRLSRLGAHTFQTVWPFVDPFHSAASGARQIDGVADDSQ